MVYRRVREGADAEQPVIHLQGTVWKTSKKEGVVLDASHADPLVGVHNQHPLNQVLTGHTDARVLHIGKQR